jgi:hypothetical protein
MKTGRTIKELAIELERRSNAKADRLAKTEAVELVTEEQEVDGAFNRLIKMNVGSERFGINEYSHNQLGSYCGIPAQYYDRCRNEDPDLLIYNVNTWVHKKNDTRLVRTLDGNVRAWLSNSYRPLENEELAAAILPILLNDGEFDIASCDVTDTRLYLKVVGKALGRELAKTGHYLGDGGCKIVDVVFPAIVISNSEVGAGALSIQRAVYTRACSNLGIYGEKSMRKYHVGARNDLMPDALTACFSDTTKRLNDAALWSQVQDVVRDGFNAERFDATVAELSGAQQDRIEKDADVVKVVKIAGLKLGIRESEQKGVLQALIEGGDLSRYGLHNAVTRFSQGAALSYDRATELERIGAQVIELPKNDWAQIAKAN